MKQYYIGIAQGLNCRLVVLNDGKVEQDKSVSGLKLIEITEDLEARGYQQAYYVKEYKDVVEDAKMKLKEAESQYEFALKNPLEISEEDARRIRL